MANRSSSRERELWTRKQGRRGSILSSRVTIRNKGSAPMTPAMTASSARSVAARKGAGLTSWSRMSATGSITRTRVELRRWSHQSVPQSSSGAVSGCPMGPSGRCITSLAGLRGWILLVGRKWLSQPMCFFPPFLLILFSVFLYS
jgi:hypothetical protein